MEVTRSDRGVPSPLPLPARSAGEARPLRRQGRLQPPLLPRERPLLGGPGPRPRRDRGRAVPGQGAGAPSLSSLPPDPRGEGCRPRPGVGAEADRDHPALEGGASRSRASPHRCRRRSSARVVASRTASSSAASTHSWLAATGSPPSWSATTTPRRPSARRSGRWPAGRRCRPATSSTCTTFSPAGPSGSARDEGDQDRAERACTNALSDGLRDVQEPGAVLPRPRGPGAVRLPIRLGHDGPGGGGRPFAGARSEARRRPHGPRGDGDARVHDGGGCRPPSAWRTPTPACRSRACARPVFSSASGGASGPCRAGSMPSPSRSASRPRSPPTSPSRARSTCTGWSRRCPR